MGHFGRGRFGNGGRFDLLPVRVYYVVDFNTDFNITGIGGLPSIFDYAIE